MVPLGLYEEVNEVESREGKVQKCHALSFIFMHLYSKQINFFYSGVDLKTDQVVAIKFATEETSHALEDEFINYMYLGADGKYLNFSM